MELSSPKIKKFLIFYNPNVALKNFLIFLGMELFGNKIKKISYIFSKRNFSYFHKWNPIKTLLILKEETFQYQKIKTKQSEKFFIF